MMEVHSPCCNYRLPSMAMAPIIRQSCTGESKRARVLPRTGVSVLCAEEAGSHLDKLVVVVVPVKERLLPEDLMGAQSGVIRAISCSGSELYHNPR